MGDRFLVPRSKNLIRFIKAHYITCNGLLLCKLKRGYIFPLFPTIFSDKFDPTAHNMITAGGDKHG